MVPDDLADYIDESWFGPELGKGMVSVTQVEDAYIPAKENVEAFKDAEKWCEKVKELLQTAETKEDIAIAVKELLEHRGVRDVLEAAILFDAIQPKASPVYEGDSLITVSESTEEGGYLSVIIQRRYFRFGFGSGKEPWRKNKLEKMLNAIKYADKNFILQLLNSLPPLISEQRELARKIVEEANLIIEGKTHWICKVTIVNCGMSPMIIWPSADLLIRDPRSKARYRIPCNLGIEKKDEDDAQDLIGVRVVAPGESIGVWAATVDVQDEIQNGTVLRELYKAGNVNAQVLLTIKRRGWSFGTRFRSSKTFFAQP